MAGALFFVRCDVFAAIRAVAGREPTASCLLRDGTHPSARHRYLQGDPGDAKPQRRSRNAIVSRQSLQIHRRRILQPSRNHAKNPMRCPDANGFASPGVSVRKA
jgi:hypothetical protein